MQGRSIQRSVSRENNDQGAGFIGFISNLFAPHCSALWTSFESFLLLLGTIIVAGFALFASNVYGVYNLFQRLLQLNSNTPSKFANPKAILITGASSGIGEYLAYQYAQSGATNIYITGRNAERLDKVANKCRELNSTVSIVKIQVDVTDIDAMEYEIQKADQATPLNLVIANAGISEATLSPTIPRRERFRTVIDTNVNGVANTIFPVLDRFKERKSGQFCIVGSIAGFAQLPNNNPYPASKAAVYAMGMAFRKELEPYGVGVTIACPGYVDTPLTQERNQSIKGGLPMIMSGEEAAKIMIDGTSMNAAVVTFPIKMFIGGWILRILPPQLHELVSMYISTKMSVHQGVFERQNTTASFKDSVNNVKKTASSKINKAVNKASNTANDVPASDSKIIDDVSTSLKPTHEALSTTDDNIQKTREITSSEPESKQTSDQLD